MKTKPITEIILDSSNSTLTVYRRHQGNTYTEQRDIDRIMVVLNRGKYMAAVQLYPNRIAAHTITYKPMKLREDQYRELLRYAWDFVDNNIDGRFGGWLIANRIWNVLGAAVALDKFSRKAHLNDLIRSHGPHWRDLYR